MTNHRESCFVLRLLAIVALALLLCFFVILSVWYDTAPGTTVEQWHKDNPAASEQQLIHINTATLEELMCLDNMGETKAQNIIAYRERYIRFTSVEELSHVRGISEADVARWKPYITL